ncbi:MAG: deoxyribodipyrimidine photolyase [Rhodobacteraceae bacterium TMED111]|nr:MAG: deoxyribodipyrimidine photolyase [Rhodobacteraceae bacterium TMED111]
MKSLMWFRNDLRMDDNPALREACKSSDEVHAIYIYSQNQNNKHNKANCKTEFFIENIKALESELSKINIPLNIINSEGFKDNSEIISNYAKNHSLKKVFWNNQFGVDENERDASVQNYLKSKKIEFESFDEQVVFAPGTILTGEGKPYSVFTPFKRRWIEKFNLDLLDIEFKYTKKNVTKIKSNLSEFDFQFKKNNLVDMSLWPVGEAEALSRLKTYLDKNIFRYAQDRNDPIVDGTSRLSAYLASGIISPKRCILEALKINNFELDAGEKGIVKWIDEIVWREFYKNIMFSFPRVSKGQPFQDYTKKIEWRFDENEFTAWKEGKTGFPIIDSAIKQMLSEGWMHNRLRMVVAMFFTKNMLHDWRLGEAFFMQNLIDGDFSSNNGGWQWSSSTGTDAAPYFRIFNPLTQSKNFDSEGLFIKKHIKELENVDKKEIHDPSPDTRKSQNYPKQILDLKQSRLRAIDAFNKAKNI